MRRDQTVQTFRCQFGRLFGLPGLLCQRIWLSRHVFLAIRWVIPHFDGLCAEIWLGACLGLAFSTAVVPLAKPSPTKHGSLTIRTGQFNHPFRLGVDKRLHRHVAPPFGVLPVLAETINPANPYKYTKNTLLIRRPGRSRIHKNYTLKFKKYIFKYKKIHSSTLGALELHFTIGKPHPIAQKSPQPRHLGGTPQMVLLTTVTAVGPPVRRRRRRRRRAGATRPLRCCRRSPRDHATTSLVRRRS